MDKQNSEEENGQEEPPVVFELSVTLDSRPFSCPATGAVSAMEGA